MDYKVTDIELTNVANAVRNKGGGKGQLTWPDGFIEGINAISPDYGCPNPMTWETGIKLDYNDLYVGGGSSMSLVKNTDHTVSISWNGGVNIGATIHWKTRTSVDNIDSISVKFRATARYDSKRLIKLGICNAIAADDNTQPFVAFEQSDDISGDEVVLSLDLSGYTGSYYIVIRTDGVTCTLGNFEIYYAQ